MDKQIATIEKNALEEIRVGFQDYKGKTYLDVRVYAEFDGATEHKPTKKGVTLRPDMINGMIDALQKAQAQAVKAGML